MSSWAVRVLSHLFSPRYPLRLAYVLQQSEYSTQSFLRWLRRNPSLGTAQRRGTFDYTKRGKLTVMVSYIGWLVAPVLAVWLTYMNSGLIWLVLLLFAPLTASLAVIVLNSIIQPLIAHRFQREINAAHNRLTDMPATRIAILGSYGKTTMKELLATVFSADKRISATPANKNVLISHARWVQTLRGDEEVLLFEFGEANPGDIEKMAKLSQPDIAIITGLAPAHMEGYESLQAIADDFACVADFSTHPPFINGDSTELRQRLPQENLYDMNEVDGWKVQDVQTDISGTSFRLHKDEQTFTLQSKLIGEHLVGPLALSAVIAARLGLTQKQIETGISKTQPFAHRMQPYKLNGAWIIDDTYNGTIEGMRAGLHLLGQLEATRKTYVTPGLVEQGDATISVHRELGRLIAEAAPDRVVLMDNSVRPHIQVGMEEHGFSGNLTVEKDPLAYYKNLEHHVSAGDVVLMQNDWPDGYT